MTGPAVQLTDEQRVQRIESFITVVAEMRKLAEAVVPAVIAAGARLTQAMEGLREAGILDEDFKPVRSADRPAWQSPGPPPARH